MRFRKDQGDETPEVIIVSLIDVLLTIVIFFMVTTTFNRLAPLQINLPEASAEPRDQPEASIEVTIDAQGRFFVNGRSLVNSQSETLKQALAEAAVGKEPPPPLVISADGRTPHQAVVTAMDAARQLGLLHLTFATQEATAEGTP